MTHRRILGVALILALTLATGAAVAKDKNKTIESYHANAILQTGGGASMATINIYRWSTDEERDEIVEVIKKASAENRPNSRDVAKSLRGQSKTGYAFFAGQQGYPLRYARSFDIGDGKRQIVLATDRPVSFAEVWDQSRLGDFDVSLILLTVDENGKGEGILSLGTEVKWNDSTNKLEITNVTSQPIKLGDVRPAK